ELKDETKAFIAYDQDILKGEGFVNWTKFEHPTLGTVEIGGEKDFVRTTPAFEEAKKLIDTQMPWVFEITKKLPKLSILKTEVKNISADVFKVDVWVQNENYLPFPTAMGTRNGRPAPAVLLLDGKDIQLLNGKARTAILKVDGLKAVKHSYLIQAKKGTEVSIMLESKFAGSDKAKITLSK
nr:hypothetical protein [Bacteroidales bacterium]